MITLTDCLATLSAFKHSLGLHFGIRRLGVFGSVARCENNDDSDIDIVVEVERPTLTLMYELQQALESLFACPVDLVRMRPTLSPLLKQNIQRDAVYV